MLNGNFDNKRNILVKCSIPIEGHFVCVAACVKACSQAQRRNVPREISARLYAPSKANFSKLDDSYQAPASTSTRCPLKINILKVLKFYNDWGKINLACGAGKGVRDTCCGHWSQAG